MSDIPTNPIVLEAKAVKHTGVVWEASFLYPSEEFMSSFNWDVFDSPQHRLTFQAYALIKGTDVDGRPTLKIRFNDRSWWPLPETASDTVSLRHPSA